MAGLPKLPSLPKIENRYQVGQQNHITGNRVYNGGMPSPHAGGGLAKGGYAVRDQKAKTKKDLLLKQLKSGGF